MLSTNILYTHRYVYVCMRFKRERSASRCFSLRYGGVSLPPGSIRLPASAKGNSGRGAFIWTGRHIFALPLHLYVARVARPQPFSTLFSFTFTARHPPNTRLVYIQFYHSPPSPWRERNLYPNYMRIILLCKINLCIVLSTLEKRIHLHNTIAY